MSCKKGLKLSKLKLGSTRCSTGVGARATNRDCQRSGGSRLLARVITSPVQATPNQSLELTPVVSARRAPSCHAGCLRSRKLNRASGLKLFMITGPVQLNSLR